MFYQPMAVEIEDAAAFIALAKDLKPKGRVIVFEKVGNGAYKFLTDQDGHLMGFQYNVPAPHPVSDPQGGVTHDKDCLVGRDPADVLSTLMRETEVYGREKMRLESLLKAWRKLLASSNQTTIKWTSRHQHIKNLKILVHNKRPGIGTYTICYTNDHVRKTTEGRFQGGGRKNS
jgi:hypothetical protein